MWPNKEMEVPQAAELLRADQAARREGFSYCATTSGVSTCEERLSSRQARSVPGDLEGSCAGWDFVRERTSACRTATRKNTLSRSVFLRPFRMLVERLKRTGKGIPHIRPWMRKWTSSSIGRLSRVAVSPRAIAKGPAEDNGLTDRPRFAAARTSATTGTPYRVVSCTACPANGNTRKVALTKPPSILVPGRFSHRHAACDTILALRSVFQTEPARSTATNHHGVAASHQGVIPIKASWAAPHRYLPALPLVHSNW
jgi:hypothetical protein